MTRKPFHSSLVIRHSSFPNRVPAFLLALFVAIPLAFSAQAPDAATVRGKLVEAAGKFPWAPPDGYRLSGQFTLKITGEEIPYRATYRRSPQEWVAEFVQANPTRSMRCGSAPQAWVSTPEVTADAAPRQLPFCAQYDFPLLYSELLRILAEGKGGPEFRLESDGHEVAVRGRLWNGLRAVFIFYTTDYSLKKVSLRAPGEAQPAWLIPILQSNGTTLLQQLPPGKSDGFEVWFSQVSDLVGFRHPVRTDYISQGGSAASFVLESAAPLKAGEGMPERPPYLPWLEGITFRPGWDPHRPSLLVGVDELPRFRSRLDSPPWSDWRRANMLAAAWANAALVLARCVPSVSSPLSLTLVLALSMCGFVLLLRRRYLATGRNIPPGWLLTGGLVWLAVLLSGVAQIQMQKAPARSLISLHLAIRYAVTGSPMHAAAARRLLETLPDSGAPAADGDRADACRAYALAYDLISPGMNRNKQAQLERILFDYASPLYGALQGWRFSSAEGSRFAAGVGMVGLATGYEEYVRAARSAMEDLLGNQLSGGLHREGPGPGAEAFDAAADFFAAVKHSGGQDYFLTQGFQDYVRATLLMTSPVGTLPLFQGTGLDHASHYVPFLLKAANHVPDDIAGRCVAAYRAYWRLGRYSTRGFSKVRANVAKPERFFLADPYTLFEYEESEPAGVLPAESAAFAGGQGAILRAGRGADSIYLALNARRPPMTQPARDALAFEIYAYDSLLAHGPGLPRPDHRAFELAGRTSSSNCITFNRASQSGTQSTGVAATLLNQPLFDYVRALADRAYDLGQFQRDVVLVRPEKNHPPYFLVVDEVRAIDPQATVQWYLHGKGELDIGLDRFARWTCAAFEPPSLRSKTLYLTAYPVGQNGTMRPEPGMLYYENPGDNQSSQALVMEWKGSSRFCTVLTPRTASMAETRFAPVPNLDSCRVGVTDWISLGTPEVRIRAGSFHHVSEYVAVRERGTRFPGLLMVGGTEFGLGPHSIVSKKPVFVSLDGLRGGLINFRPDTDVELRSPEIVPSTRFYLDGKEIAPSGDGRLILRLGETGEHTLALSSTDR